MTPSNDNPAPAVHTAAHLRALRALHDSLYAPQFRALETYGEIPREQPQARDILIAARAVCAWHENKEKELATLLSAQRAANAAAILIDETLRLLAHHRGECDRITASLHTVQADDGFVAETVACGN